MPIFSAGCVLGPLFWFAVIQRRDPVDCYAAIYTNNYSKHEKKVKRKAKQNRNIMRGIFY
jgi:hypothetical protein